MSLRTINSSRVRPVSVVGRWSWRYGLVGLMLLLWPGTSHGQSDKLKERQAQEGTSQAVPDLDIRYITRLPRLPWDGPKPWPDLGEAVRFEAYVANRGAVASSRQAARWMLDGQRLSEATVPPLEPGAEAVLQQPWSWLGQRHALRLQLDPENQLAESSESNNDLTIDTHALAFGMWVEQSLYDFFNLHIQESGWGGNSFDDWVQRHVMIWNDMLAEARWPSSPDGVLDRVRVDKIVVVPDGDLRCETNRPVVDREVDLMWGLPSEIVGVASPARCNWLPRYRDDPSVWDTDIGILHELSHARYLVDLYGLNVGAHRDQLAGDLSGSATSFDLEQAPDLPEFQAGSRFVIGGEILSCRQREGRSFHDCQRGLYRTRARSHSAGAPVWADQIFVTDGRGNALVGTTALPDESQSFYVQADFGFDLMNSGMQYGEHSAYAWNRIAGQRARCGNYNAPCNIGEYLNDLPARVVLELRDETGRLLPGVQVAVYRAHPYAIWYGKTYQEPADQLMTADASGRVQLEPEPFGPQGLVHGYGHSNAVLLLVVSDADRMGTAFLDVSTLNVAYARGQRDRAILPLTLQNWTAVPSQLPTFTPLPPTAVPTLPPATPAPTAASGEVLLSYAVDARQPWQSTGLTYSAEAEMRFEVAQGLWTHWLGTVPHNPGTGAEYICGELLPPELCAEPLPQVPSGMLIGRVGDRPFGIGQSRREVSQATGPLHLRINDADDGLGDNDGVLSVRAGVRTAVDARSPWQPTGLILGQGTQIGLRVVDGLWTHWLGTVPPNPGTGGDYVCAEHLPPEQCREPMAHAPAGQLIGRVGGQLFSVGQHGELSIMTSGALELRINDADDGLNDNEGRLAVDIWAGPQIGDPASAASPTSPLPTPSPLASRMRTVTPTPSRVASAIALTLTALATRPSSSFVFLPCLDRQSVMTTPRPVSTSTPSPSIVATAAPRPSATPVLCALVEAEPNDLPAQALGHPVLCEGRVIGGEIGAGGAQDSADYYTLSVDRTLRVKVSMNAITLRGATELDLGLWTCNSEGCTQRGWSGQRGSASEVVDVPLESGTYFVGAHPQGSLGGRASYQLEWSVVP